MYKKSPGMSNSEFEDLRDEAERVRLNYLARRSKRKKTKYEKKLHPVESLGDEGYIYLSGSKKVKRQKPSRSSEKRKIKGINFKKGRIFSLKRSDAKIFQSEFQDRGHLTRIIRSKEKINNKMQEGFYLYFSEKRLRKRK